MSLKNYEPEERYLVTWLALAFHTDNVDVWDGGVGYVWKEKEFHTLGAAEGWIRHLNKWTECRQAELYALEPTLLHSLR